MKADMKLLRWGFALLLCAGCAGGEEVDENMYRTEFETSKGTFVIEVRRDWAPLGAERFYNLVQDGFFDDNRFFRVLDGFVAQWGINGDPQLQSSWAEAAILDEPVVMGNTRGRVTFAHGGPNTRTTQMFINYGDNSRLDEMGFPAIGEVVEGMEVVDALYSAYGDGPPTGTGPEQGSIQAEGNAYLDANYPELDRIVRASITAGG